MEGGRVDWMGYGKKDVNGISLGEKLSQPETKRTNHLVSSHLRSSPLQSLNHLRGGKWKMFNETEKGRFDVAYTNSACMTFKTSRIPLLNGFFT